MLRVGFAEQLRRLYEISTPSKRYATIMMEIHAELPEGAPEHIVRTVNENCRTLKFTNYGFEKE